MPDELAAARAKVAEAHELVVAGRYDQALGIFRGALDVLRAKLGEAHPEVEELEEDLDAARQMRELHAFGRSVGYRDWLGPDDPGEHES